MWLPKISAEERGGFWRIQSGYSVGPQVDTVVTLLVLLLRKSHLPWLTDAIDDR